MAKDKPDGHIWGVEFNRYVCFWFQTFFGYDIANSICERTQFKSMAKVQPEGHIGGLEFNRYTWFLFHGSEAFLTERSKIPYWTLKLLSQGLEEYRQKFNQAIYMTESSNLLKVKEIRKVVRRLSLEQNLGPRRRRRTNQYKNS